MKTKHSTARPLTGSRTSLGHFTLSPRKHATDPVGANHRSVTLHLRRTQNGRILKSGATVYRRMDPATKTMVSVRRELIPANDNRYFFRPVRTRLDMQRNTEDAIASVSLEGTKPTADTIAMLHEIDKGRMTYEQALARLKQRYTK